MTIEMDVLEKLNERGGKSIFPASTSTEVAALRRLEKKGFVKRVFGGRKTLREGAASGNAWYELTKEGFLKLGFGEYTVTVHYATAFSCGSKKFDGIIAASDDDAVTIAHSALRQNPRVVKIYAGDIDTLVESRRSCA